MTVIRRKPGSRRSGRSAAACVAAPSSEVVEIDPHQEKRLQFLFMAILLVFGIYQSILYYGHQIIPNSDFFDFIRSGRSLWAFQLPASFKRAPVVGFLQVGISKIVGGPHAELTAGWILNSILHPLNALLLYLISRRLIGRTAFLFAALCIINPWILDTLVHPIAETTLLFFILLTFWLMFIRSRWAYLAASIATMTRYEGAVLIFAAFVWDQIDAKNPRRRWISLGLAIAASIPLAAWLWGTYVTWRPGASHYINHYGHRTCIKNYWGYLWQVTALNWFRWPGEIVRYFLDQPDSKLEVQEMIAELRPWYWTVRVLGSIAGLSGILIGLFKRRWEILSLLLFAIPFFFIHSLRARTQPRYCVPIAWIVLLLCWYGLQQSWIMIHRKRPIHPYIAVGLQSVLIVVSLIWLQSLLGYFFQPSVQTRSVQSNSLPYVAYAIVLLYLLIDRWIDRFRFRFGSVTLGVVMALIVLSNQFLVIFKLGSGENDKEFRMLAEWYCTNAKPGEKLVTTMTSVVGLYAKPHESNFVGTSTIGGATFGEFFLNCFRQNISYVAWDSRIGLMPGDAYYKTWRMERIHELKEARDHGPFEFITQIKHTNRRYINLYRLRRAGFDDEVSPIYESP